MLQSDPALRNWRRSCVRDVLYAALLTAFALLALVQPTVAADARRIVSIGGSVTEIVYALGAAQRLAGVDSTSQYPEAARTLPNVGYMRALSAEGVLSLDPDLILTLDGSGPPPVLAVLEASSVPVVTIPDDPSPEGILAKIAAVGEALELEGEAQRLQADVKAALDAALADAAVASADGQKKVLFVLSPGDGKPVVAGQDTAADAIIRMAGGVNAVTGFTGYKPVSAEALIEAAPDAILTMNRHGDDSAAAMLALPGLELTPAGRTKTVVAMDGLTLLGFGPRTAEAVRDLAQALAGRAQNRSDTE